MKCSARIHAEARAVEAELGKMTPKQKLRLGNEIAHVLRACRQINRASSEVGKRAIRK
jgi:hypothetical protein